MAVQTYQLPTMQEIHDAELASRKSRHVSLESHVESLAKEYWRNRDSMPDIPAAYGHRSTDYLIDDSSTRRPSRVDSVLEPVKLESGMGHRRSTPDPVGILRKGMKISTLHEVLFIGSVVMAQFMTLAGLGQSIAPMNIIGRSLGVSNPGQQAYFAASYSLTVGTFILVAGRMGDILGHKRMFVFGYFFLGVWSGFAGFCVYVPNPIFFDICRAFQGLGAAMLAPNGLALLGRAYPPGMKKNLVFSLFGAMAPWGFVVGALCSSAFSQLVWWPWAFWSYAFAAWGLSIFALLVVPKCLAYKAQFEGGNSKKPGMDFTGAILGVGGLVLINIAWNNGPLFGWRTPHVIFTLVVGILLMIAFFWVEARAISPLLPTKALSSTVIFTMALIGIGWGSFGIWIFYTWRFLLDLRGLLPLTIAVQFTPALVCGLLAAGATGFMLTHTPVSFTIMVSMVAFLAGELITAVQPVHQIYWAQMFVAILIMPFGMDMSFPAGTVILSNALPKESQGLAASLINTMVNYSISIALGIAGTVEVSVNNGGATEADVLHGTRCASYTGVGLAGAGVIFAALFFGVKLRKEGWKVMEH